MTINYAIGKPVAVKSQGLYTTPNMTVCDKVNLYPDGIVSTPLAIASHTTLLVPQTVDVTAATPLVLALHGTGGTDADVVTGSIHGGGLTDSWLDHGWIVAGQASALNGAPRWGWEPSRLAAVSLWRYLQRIFTIEKILIYGMSEGGEVGINVMVESLRTSPPLPVKAWVGNSPALNLRWVASNPAAHVLRPQLSQAYFGKLAALVMDHGTVTPGDATWVAAVDTPDGGHDPCVLDLAGLPHVPMRTYVGTNDILIFPANNGVQFNQRLTDAGWAPEHDVVTFTGGHGSADSFRPADVLAFFQRALAL